jgi:hypothetical protein
MAPIARALVIFGMRILLRLGAPMILVQLEAGENIPAPLDTYN